MFRHKYTILLALIVSVVILAGSSLAIAQSPEPPASPEGGGAPVGPGFTYQGYLTEGVSPVDATCNFRFGLFGGETVITPFGSLQTVNGVLVDEGYFTVTLNDSDQITKNPFNGGERWLQIEVQCPGDAAFVDMGRVEIDAAPYAHALRPGAVIQGSGTMITVTTINQIGLVGETSSYTASDAGVLGRSKGRKCVRRTRHHRLWFWRRRRCLCREHLFQPINGPDPGRFLRGALQR